MVAEYYPILGKTAVVAPRITSWSMQQNKFARNTIDTTELLARLCKRQTSCRVSRPALVIGLFLRKFARLSYLAKEPFRFPPTLPSQPG